MSGAPRILVLLGNVPLYGQERANIEALDALCQTGCDVLFLIRAEWTQDTIQAELRRRGLQFVFVPYFDSVRHGVSLRVWWNNLKGIAEGSWQLLRQIRSFRATHIHAGSTANVLNFMPALMLTRLPLVFRAGDVPPRHHVLWRMVWQFTRRRAARFVCDSHFIKNRLVELGANPDKCSVLYAPAPRRTATLRRTEFPADNASSDLTVVYVGQISKDKGVDLLVEAALLLCGSRPDIRFVIAGDYEWNNPLGVSLVERVANSGLQERIIFTGFVENIDSLYEQADVHVCPSVWEEPYGLTVVEAKQANIPSVVFPSGGLRELVTHGVDGHVCREKTAATLIEAFEAYARERNLAPTQGAAARASLERLALDRFAENWRAVYERAAKRPTVKAE